MSPKVRKAARGKHRWIGLSLSPSPASSADLKALLESRLGAGVVRKILDFESESGTCIIKVSLPDYHCVRQALATDSSTEVNSITSSGKLKLVRKRLSDQV